VATYHYGSGSGVTSTVGERLPAWYNARSSCAPDCALPDPREDRELLRLTRMPAVRVEVGYLTSTEDRVKLIDPLFASGG